MLALVLVFCFGVVNFAAHKAVLESGHAMLGQVHWLVRPLGGKLSFLVEYALLVGAMVVVAAGSQGWALLYAAYTGVNVIAAWLILSGVR